MASEMVWVSVASTNSPMVTAGQVLCSHRCGEAPGLPCARGRSGSSFAPAPAAAAPQTHKKPFFHPVTAPEPAVPGEEVAWREVVTEGGCWEGAEAQSGDAARERGRGSRGRRARGRWVTPWGCARPLPRAALKRHLGFVFNDRRA